MSPKVTIIGAGGHAVSVANVAVSAGYSVVAFVDDNKAGQNLVGIPVIRNETIKENRSQDNFAIAIGDNAARKRVFESFLKENSNVKFPALIHKSAILGICSQIEEGTVIMPNSNIGPNSKVGRFCIINTSSSIDHDCAMGDFSSLAPGVTTGGNVLIGELSAVSIGAVVKHGVKVGDNCVVGASSYVNKDIGNNSVAYGVPCRRIRARAHGEPYLG